MTIETLDGPREAGMIGEWVSAIHDAMARLRRARAHRRQIRELFGLDDRILKDIGVDRLDIIQALARPCEEDPSTHLAAISAERRYAWRRKRAK